MSEEKYPDYKSAIASSGKSIFEPIDIGDAEYWIPTHRLEKLLNDGLCGKSLVGLSPRTRSKIAKSAVCEALGYPVPKSFKRTQPRFVGQQLDVYVQKSLNLQIWNEQISPARRYAIIQVSPDDVITRVKVVGGPQLAVLDTTGTITTKYQARLELGYQTHELVSPQDTQPMMQHVRRGTSFGAAASPVQQAETGLCSRSGKFSRGFHRWSARSFLIQAWTRIAIVALHFIDLSASGWDTTATRTRGNFPMSLISCWR